ncbi:hypothetical protein [Paenibacillus donghaensis]|uniref:Uncharacterized protein n=1 Tax=Paenibacillus donghaensis TaxID=414771 RepID=A0A2Z2KLP5_9BACL|nr:hypothetical protein [Paenibacillus donghaensis]ASA20911.1 hypothetical protein B9T62_09010 [Paenibacillus donghaensis]
MTAEEIILMEPGEQLDRLVIKGETWGSPSTDMNDAWDLRETFIEENGGDFQLIRFCDDFPEHCSWSYGDRKILVWAKTGPEAITKVVALAEHELYGDFHPWVLFPEMQKQFIENLKRNTTLFK